MLKYNQYPTKANTMENKKKKSTTTTKKQKADYATALNCIGYSSRYDCPKLWCTIEYSWWSR